MFGRHGISIVVLGLGTWFVRMDMPCTYVDVCYVRSSGDSVLLPACGRMTPRCRMSPRLWSSTFADEIACR